MAPYFTQFFGNADSKHHVFGRIARQAVAAARDTIANAIHADPGDICFTSGATESVNLAIKGLFDCGSNSPRHFITVATEHPAVLDSFRRIEAAGAEVTRLPVDARGLLDPQQIADALRPHTQMVSVMAANNEIGVLQPVREIGALCRERHILFMSDATQALGQLPLDVQTLNIHLLAGSAHKIYGPKGVGLLYCRRRDPKVTLRPLLDGGGHERGLRSGTLNVPGIVGFAKALELSLEVMATETARLRALRDELFQLLAQGIPGLRLNGHPDHRLAGNLNVCIPGIVNESLIIALAEEVAFSIGSACSTTAVDPSHVLRALGLSSPDVNASVRFGLGRATNDAKVRHTAQAVIAAVARLRRQTFG
jgi:cysteine desulfurase